METHNFYDTGQRNEYPAPEDFWSIDTFSDNAKVKMIRHTQFFCKGQEITLGKMREFFTNKAIEIYEHDGFIEINRF